jgi:hypothetical protein
MYFNLSSKVNQKSSLWNNLIPKRKQGYIGFPFYFLLYKHKNNLGLVYFINFQKRVKKLKSSWRFLKRKLYTWSVTSEVQPRVHNSNDNYF